MDSRLQAKSPSGGSDESEVSDGSDESDGSDFLDSSDMKERRRSEERRLLNTTSGNNYLYIAFTFDHVLGSVAVASG